jgi:predicted nucleotidyltransferase
MAAAVNGARVPFVRHGRSKSMVVTSMEIVKVSEQLRSLLRELRSRFEALYGPRLVRLMLFGSHARGDAEPGSDIDVLVVLEGPVRSGEEIRRSINDVAELSLENSVVFSCVFVSRERFESELTPLLINARREGVPV